MYTIPYFANKPKPAVLVCFVSPGNTRPIIEHYTDPDYSFLGVPIENGYQSHYVLTDKSGKPCPKVTEHYYDELVIAAEPQIVPIFLVTISKSNLMKVLLKFQRVIPTQGMDIKKSRRDGGEEDRKIEGDEKNRGKKDRKKEGDAKNRGKKDRKKKGEREIDLDEKDDKNEEKEKEKDDENNEKGKEKDVEIDLDEKDHKNEEENEKEKDDENNEKEKSEDENGEEKKRTFLKLF